MGLSRQSSSATESTQAVNTAGPTRSSGSGYGNAFLASMMPGVSAEGGPGQGARTATGFSAAARALFGRLDKDRDGYLSEAEIDAAMIDRSIRGDEAAVVATLKELRGDLEELSDDEWGDENDGVTMADLEQYERTGSVPKELRDRVEGRFGWSKYRIGQSAPGVFNGAPDPTAVTQGSIGDCYFLAAVVGQAYRDPRAVRRMITDNGDATYTVTFPGRSAVTVPAPTDAELARYSSSGANGLWLSILEKAYGQVRNDESWFGSTTVAQEGADGGAQLSTGVSAVTGSGTDTDILSFTSLSTTRAKLEAAMKAGRVVTAGTTKALPWQEENAGGIVSGHAFTVVAYDRGSDTITLRNPWGSTEPTNAQGQAADGRDDGVFQMKLPDFDSRFANICYQE